jgi:hypothetical protein
MRGRVGVRPFIRGKGDNWVEKGYTSLFNSPHIFKKPHWADLWPPAPLQARMAYRPEGRAYVPRRDTEGLHKATGSWENESSMRVWVIAGAALLGSGHYLRFTNEKGERFSGTVHQAYQSALDYLS